MARKRRGLSKAHSGPLSVHRMTRKNPKTPRRRSSMYPVFYTPLHLIAVGPNLEPHALTEVEFGEPKKAGGVLILVVFGCLPTASSIQDHASGIQKLVGSVIIPWPLLHTYLPLVLGPPGSQVTLQQV
jgi:hypothetical protein